MYVGKHAKIIKNPMDPNGSSNVQSMNQRSPTIDLLGSGANEDPSSSKDLGGTLALGKWMLVVRIQETRMKRQQQTTDMRVS